MGGELLWRNFRVEYQGDQEISRLNSSEAPKEEVLFPLPDGRTLSLKLRP